MYQNFCHVGALGILFIKYGIKFSCQTKNTYSKIHFSLFGRKCSCAFAPPPINIRHCNFANLTDSCFIWCVYQTKNNRENWEINKNQCKQIFFSTFILILTNLFKYQTVITWLSCGIVIFFQAKGTELDPRIKLVYNFFFTNKEFTYFVCLKYK